MVRLANVEAAALNIFNECCCYDGSSPSSTAQRLARNQLTFSFVFKTQTFNVEASDSTRSTNWDLYNSVSLFDTKSKQLKRM